MMRYQVLSQNFRRATLLVMLGLLIVIAANCVVFPNHDRGLSLSVTLWAVSSLPLLIFLPGMWRGLISSYAWLSYVSLLYFLSGVLAVFAPARRGFDMALLILSIMLFLTAMLSVRYSARAAREKISSDAALTPIE